MFYGKNVLTAVNPYISSVVTFFAVNQVLTRQCSQSIKFIDKFEEFEKKTFQTEFEKQQQQ